MYCSNLDQWTDPWTGPWLGSVVDRDAYQYRSRHGPAWDSIGCHRMLYTVNFSSRIPRDCFNDSISMMRGNLESTKELFW